MRKSQQGLTILEMLIALVLGLILFAGVMSIFVGMRVTTQETTSYGELQENGRFALSMITNDLIRQGFWGDMDGNLDFAGLTQTIDPALLAGDCIGGGANNASFPIAIGHFRTLWGTTVVGAANMGCINDAVIGSDIIQIKRAISSPVLPANVAANRYYLASNPNSAAIFAGNAAVPNLNFARLWEYQHHVYYISNEAQGNDVVPVLRQGQLTNVGNAMNFSMVVEGIERIRFMYGVDTDDDGAVNAFISANNMTNAFWDNENDVSILAVKVYVLARDILRDQKYTNTNTYQLGDLAVQGNGDNYRRLLFSSTITLHNARSVSWPP